MQSWGSDREDLKQNSEDRGGEGKAQDHVRRLFKPPGRVGKPPHGDT